MSLSKPSQIDAVDAGGSGPSVQPAHFMKLNVDCWEKIFDYLSLRNILSMSKTCKRMQHIGGYYYRNNFPKMGVRYDVNRGFHINGVPALNDFLQLVDSLALDEDCEQVLIAKRFCSVKNLSVQGINLSDTQVACIKDLLKNVEELSVIWCFIDVDIYDRILKHCPQLKRLTYSFPKWQPQGGENWMRQEYPMIQHLSLWGEVITDSNAIIAFLEKNPNLKRLEINAKDLWAIRDSIAKTNDRLSNLAVNIDSFDFIYPVEPMELFNLLNSLYGHGFYKSLKIKWDFDDEDHQQLPNGMATLKGLRRVTLLKNMDVSFCSELTELGIFDPIDMDMKQLATKLTKLKRIEFGNATTDDILPFIQHTIKLNTVVVWQLTGGSLLVDDVLNLFALNREREKLERAHRIWVHVMEHVYLPTKWKAKHLNLKLIELKRLESDVDT